jgi:hypothetical protein
MPHDQKIEEAKARIEDAERRDEEMTNELGSDQAIGSSSKDA